MSRYVCKDCGNTVIGSPICATCGAQKLYDATLRSVEQRAERAGRELAAYQAEMPEAPERLTMTRNLASGMATETVVVAHRYDVLAKRCARLTVELEAARNLLRQSREYVASARMDEEGELTNAIDAAISEGVGNDYQD